MEKVAQDALARSVGGYQNLSVVAPLLDLDEIPEGDLIHLVAEMRQRVQDRINSDIDEAYRSIRCGEIAQPSSMCLQSLTELTMPLDISLYNSPVVATPSSCIVY